MHAANHGAARPPLTLPSVARNPRQQTRPRRVRHRGEADGVLRRGCGDLEQGDGGGGVWGVCSLQSGQINATATLRLQDGRPRSPSRAAAPPHTHNNLPSGLCCSAFLLCHTSLVCRSAEEKGRVSWGTSLDGRVLGSTAATVSKLTRDAEGRQTGGLRTGINLQKLDD